MKVSNRQLAEAVLADIESGKSRGKVMSALAAYLVSERRSKDADAVLREVSNLLEQRKGQVELRIKSVRGLSEQLKKQVVSLIAPKAKSVVINEEQDPSVLGGVLVESSEKRLDLTVRRQIQRLKGAGA